MTLSSGIQKKPVKVVICGPEGIGKSTFAAAFPSPVFIDTERSTTRMDVRRYDEIDSWQKVLQAVDFTIANKDKLDIKTLVVDTADWAELFAIVDMCLRMKVNNIEDIGYGKGYVYLQDTFKKLLDKLDQCIDAGINVVVTAHTKMRKFEQPDEMGAYDRWELKLTKQVAPMLKEWADAVFFANYKTYVVTDDKTKSKKAQGGKRVMYTTHHACWDAKNRFGLDECIDFSFDAIKHIVPIPEQKAAEPKKAEPALDVHKDAPEQVSMAYHELKKLMDEAQITDEEVQCACSTRGLQDGKLEVWNYPEDFINNMLIAKFKGFSSYINKEIKQVPYIKHWAK